MNRHELITECQLEKAVAKSVGVTLLVSWLVILLISSFLAQDFGSRPKGNGIVRAEARLLQYSNLLTP